MIAEETAGAEFEALAARRLRREPPRLGDKRSDLKGDHSLDRGDWLPDYGSPPRQAAVLVPVIAHEASPTILLTQRAAHLRQHAGQIAFPGGRVDAVDPSPAAAALREAEEEIGLRPELVRPLGYLDAYLSGTNYLVMPVVGLIEPGFRLHLNPSEVDDAFEVPLDFLMNASNHALHQRDWKGGRRTYYAIPFGERYIWGVTAGILRNMRERLYGPW